MTQNESIYNTPFFTDEHRRLATSVANFAAREIEPRRAHVEGEDADDRFRHLLSVLAQADLLRYAVGAEQASAPIDARALCLVRDELSYCSPLADLVFVMQGLGTHAIRLAAREHVRDFWLERARTGKAIAAFALTEPEAGSDASAVQTTATQNGDQFVINGTKRYISNVGLADFYTVFARTGTRSDGRAEISAFVVGAKLQGVFINERLQMLGDDHPIGEVVFENARVPRENMLGAAGDGYKLAMQTMDCFRASVGAAACGMARRALDESLNRVRTRTQFGKPLAEYQITQTKLADMITHLDAARLLVYRAAHQRDTQPKISVTRVASEAKLFATEAANKIIDEAVQLHGASGLEHGSVVAELYRAVRALRIYEGTSEIQKLIIAGQILKR